MLTLTLSELIALTNSSVKSIYTRHAERCIQNFHSYELLIDHFDQVKAISIRLFENHQLNLEFDKPYQFEQAISGSYIGKPQNKSDPYVWLPILPRVRLLNEHQQILHEDTTLLQGLSWKNQRASFSLQAPDNSTLDLVIWCFPNNFAIEELTSLLPIESQGYFLWGSHGCINKPSDLYHHLVHGAVYDLRYSWPDNKKCFSENEAHALYTIFSGLEKATEKSIYRFLQLQIVLSVIQSLPIDHFVV